MVFSDEFNVAGRSFHDGQDPRWTAVNKDDYTNYALQYYNGDLAKTTNGYLNISTIKRDRTFSYEVKPGTSGKQTKNYQSAMINGWNKFCFTGGIVEISARLPGRHDIAGLWPAMWMMGNLARATYVGSSDNMWPWSYNVCSRKMQKEQEISACNEVGHFNINRKQGRGAPEIDILEAMAGVEKLLHTPISRPYYSASLQVSPAIQNYRPTAALPPDMTKWYNHGIEYGPNTSLNIFFYGDYLYHLDHSLDYATDAISANRDLQKTHYEDFHKYRLEWIPGATGYIKWYLDDVLIYSIDASALNKTKSHIPSEPMYLLFNTAISATWGFPSPCPKGCHCDCFDCAAPECACGVPHRMCENFPASFLIDYVRVYQAKGDPSQMVSCSPPGHRTKDFIRGHVRRYMSATDKAPLKDVPAGSAKCDDDSQCGYGTCVKKQCVCTGGYVGPNCLAAKGFDDVDLDPDEGRISIDFLFVPVSLYMVVVLVALALVAVVGYKYRYDRQKRGPYRMAAMGQYKDAGAVQLEALNRVPYQPVR